MGTGNPHRRRVAPSARASGWLGDVMRVEYFESIMGDVATDIDKRRWKASEMLVKLLS